MSQSLDQILENAHVLFQQRLAQQMAEERKRWAGKAEQIARERAELLGWLAQFIPDQLLEYIDTSEYSHDDAGVSTNYQPGGDTSGIVLEIAAPGAAPIHFRVHRFRNEFSFTDVSFGAGSGFCVPLSWRIRRDPDWDEGRPYVLYTWGEGDSDFTSALGFAVSFFRQHGAAIESALTQATADFENSQRFSAAADAAVPSNLSLEERQVQALEAIAEALRAMAFNSI